MLLHPKKPYTPRYVSILLHLHGLPKVPHPTDRRAKVGVTVETLAALIRLRQESR